MLRRLGQLGFSKSQLQQPLVKRYFTTEPVQEVYRAKKRKFNFGTALLCTIPFVTFYLGTWQLQRLRWKVQLISTLEDRLEREPIPLPKRIK